MKLNIEWPEKREIKKGNLPGQITYDRGYNHCLDDCKQAVDKAIKKYENTRFIYAIDTKDKK